MRSLDTELKQQIDDTVARYLADQYSFEDRQQLVASDVGYSRDNWSQFAELGWLSIPFAEDKRRCWRQCGRYGGNAPIIR